MTQLNQEEVYELADETLKACLQGLSETTCLKCDHHALCHFRRTAFNALGNWGDTKEGTPFIKLGKRVYAEVWLYGLAYFCNHFQSSNPTANTDTEEVCRRG